MNSWDAWRAGGERLTVGGRKIFVRTRGSGPVVTLVHGFPTSSWDWARVEPLLAADHTVVTLDLLGYGASDKPRDHRYSTGEHADVVQAVWNQLDVDSSVLVGHDVGSSVARELLTRERQTPGAVPVEAVLLHNGGLLPELYRPTQVTRLLANPLLGPLVARRFTEDRYVAALAALYSDAGRPPAAELHDAWRALTSEAGTALLPALVHYLRDAKENGARWRSALLDAPVPVAVVWGAADPAIPRAVADGLRDLRPSIPVTMLEGVGHFPQVERPAAVADAVRTLERSLSER